MIGREMDLADPVGSNYFQELISTKSPECETHFCLQLLVSQLLLKNQKLRMELVEARCRLAHLESPGLLRPV